MDSKFYSMKKKKKKFEQPCFKIFNHMYDIEVHDFRQLHAVLLIRFISPIQH